MRISSDLKAELKIEAALQDVPVHEMHDRIVRLGLDTFKQQREQAAASQEVA